MAAACAEDLHRGAIRHDHGRHVLHDSGDTLAGLLRHRAGTLSDLSGGCLRRSDDEELRVGDELCDRKRDIAGTRRQVEEKNVKIAPEDIAQELLKRAVEHRAAPHDGGIALDELADGDELKAVRDGRQQHFLIDDRGRFHIAQETGDGVAVNIGIDDANLEAAGGECGAQIGRHGRLAHAALAGGHGEDARGGIRLGEGDFRLGLAAAQLLLEGTTLVVIHRVHGHGHGAHALEVFEHRAGVLFDGVFHGAASDGEVDLDRDIVAVNGDGFHHVQLGNRATDFGVLDAGQCLAYVGFFNCVSHISYPS